MSTVLEQEVRASEVITPSVAPDVDANRPWPGLFPFREEQRDFFFGRDDESDDLLGCVKRETITLLFGKSGLGKSSLLQAGLFPELRESGFLPIYIKLSFAESAPPLISQVKSTVQDAVAKEDFAEAEHLLADDSLWEYLHRRDTHIRNRIGQQVCPVLVFDQFEEIFTLGGSTESGRKLRDDFVEFFAQLVENYIPPKLRERLAENPKLAERYDFSAPGCRILVSMREDYLPKLEKLRSHVPSLVFATSRMRLTEMTGVQALDAVSRPNPDLVTKGVAEHIVRFVAGDTSDGKESLEALEVQPAILSLFCRELSIKRGEAPQITEELVSGNAKTIIEDFYRRCIAEQPREVRCIIEDKLVTKWGYRDSIDLRQAKAELEASGVSGTKLDALVNERLLRIEEHRDNPRIELTHDVLVEPVMRSREQRLRDEAVKEALKQERERREQARRETKARRLQTLLVLGIIVTVILLASCVISIRMWRRAEAASEAAREAKVAAEVSAAKATAASHQADNNYDFAVENWQEASRRGDAEQAAKEAAQESRSVSEKRAKDLESALSDYEYRCDDTSRIFAEVAAKLRQGTQSESAKQIAAAFSKLYEKVALGCLQGAQKMHDVAPENYRMTNYLGTVGLEMADSAIGREDSSAANDYIVNAVDVAKKLQTEPYYKSQLVAAKILARAGYSFAELKEDARAQKTGEQGLELMAKIQANIKTAQLDAWDWDAIAKVYMWNALTFAGSNPGRAIGLYENAYAAEIMALAKDRNLRYLQLAITIAGSLGEAESKVHAGSAKSADWYRTAKKLVNQKIEILSTKSNSQKEIADTLSYGVEIDNALRDWNSAYNDTATMAQIYSSLLDRAKKDSDKEDLTDKLSSAYGSMAWYDILLGRPEQALQNAQTGLAYDPKQDWIQVNRAHALLFLGRVNEAGDLYRIVAPTKRKDHQLSEDISADFQELCEAGLAQPEMIDIAHNLKIDTPKLMSCLTKATARE